MEQTFLAYVTTNPRFWAASALASARSILVPVALVGTGVSLTAAPPLSLLVLAAMALFVVADGMVLVVRMARRIALGSERPNDLLDRGVLDNAVYLHLAYHTAAGRARLTAG